MKHFGDITKIKGSEVPLTEIVVGGSPCQDLSVAGKRAGLAGERSGLFMEQIRIIKEMRDESYKELSMQGSVDPCRIIPRFMVWENVPGALSSGTPKGGDFRCVLEETAKVAEGDACIPGPPGGKWPTAGCIMGDGWSIAWRVHDAQFWGKTIRDSNTGNVLALGTPQRRRRIALVADFGGATAPEILFERKGMSGDITESGEQGKDAASDVRSGIEETIATQIEEFVSAVNKDAKHQQDLIQSDLGVARTLAPGTHASGSHLTKTLVTSSINAGDNQQAVVYGISSYNSNAMKSDNPNSGIYEAETARTLDLNGGSPACNQGGMAVVQGADMYNGAITGDIAATLNARSCVSGGQSGPSVICIEGNGQRESHKGDGYKESDIMYTLNTVEQHAVACGTKYTEEPYNATTGSFMRAGNSGIAETLAARDYKDPQIVCNSVVRRLTPLECERLQGFPDHWTDIGDWIDSKGKTHKGDSDSPRYKALGNSIALPYWSWMAHKMVKYIDGHQPTMASLFSGIGGFELVFARAGCKPVWNSEIESFPEAVTRVHFGDDDLGIEGDYEQYL